MPTSERHSMSEWQLETPVAFISFNRPDTTVSRVVKQAEKRWVKMSNVRPNPEMLHDLAQAKQHALLKENGYIVNVSEE